jgi:glutaredoxin-related protein
MPRAVLDEAHIHPDARERVASYHSAVVQEVRDAIAASDIVVVGMRMNPWPKKARRLLDAAGLPYKYLEYGSYLGDWRRRLAIKMWSGWPTYPMVFVKGVLVGGSSELQKLLQRGPLL